MGTGKWRSAHDSPRRLGLAVRIGKSVRREWLGSMDLLMTIHGPYLYVTLPGILERADTKERVATPKEEQEEEEEVR